MQVVPQFRYTVHFCANTVKWLFFQNLIKNLLQWLSILQNLFIVLSKKNISSPLYLILLFNKNYYNRINPICCNWRCMFCYLRLQFLNACAEIVNNYIITSSERKPSVGRLRVLTDLFLKSIKLEWDKNTSAKIY